MFFVYAPSVTGQMRQWIADAVKRSVWPFDQIGATVTFDVQDEPPAPGHKDIMCTTGGDGAYIVTIRAGVDQPDSRVARGLPNPASDIRTFFGECIVHELAHVVTFELVTTDELKSEVAGMLRRAGVMGEGDPPGELEDWNDADYPWEDRVIEAVAEIVKDAALPSRYRIYDNRTNYEIERADWETFFALLTSNITFEDRFPGDALDPLYGVTLVGEDAALTVSDNQVHIASPTDADAQAYLTRPDVTPRGRTVLAVELDWPDVIADGAEPGYNAGLTIRDDDSGASSGGIAFDADATLAVQAATPGHGGSYFSLFLTTYDQTDFHSDNVTVPIMDFIAPVWLTLEENEDGQTYAGVWSAEPPEEGGEADLAWLAVASGAPVGAPYLGVWLHTQSGEARSSLIRTGGDPIPAPPWPYEDPTISGGQGESGVMRFVGR